MAKKIVTFFSLLRAGGKEESYDYPNRGNGEKICGRQTNEAPLKYLMQTYFCRGEDITLIALCTPEVYDLVPEEGVDTFSFVCDSLECFCRRRKLETPRVEEVKIRALEEHLEEALAQVMEHIQRGDEIFIDATGGPRDANFMNILLMQALSYKGCAVREMVYSFFGQSEKCVRSLREVSRVMDTTSAMAEFSTYGRTRLMEQVFPEDDALPAEVCALKRSLKRFSDMLELCSYGKDGRALENCLKEIRKNIDACRASSSLNAPLFRQLLPVFEEKFSAGGGAFMLPGIVRWCAENHMIQQALTIYNENILRFFRINGIFTFVPCWVEGKLHGEADAETNPRMKKISGDQVTPKLLLSRGVETQKQNLSTAFRLRDETSAAAYQAGMVRRAEALFRAVERPETLKIRKTAEVRYYDGGVMNILKCLFTETWARRSRRESAAWIFEFSMQELLPLLGEPELAALESREEVVAWLATERARRHIVSAAWNRSINRTVKDGFWADLELCKCSGGLSLAAQGASVNDLYMALLERELLRELRNQINHGGSAGISERMEECAVQFDALGVNAGWKKEISLREVRARLIAAADRLESLYEQVQAAKEFESK